MPSKSKKPAKSAKKSVPARVASKRTPSKGKAKPAKGAATPLDSLAEYRHDEATRKNNPPAKIAAEGTVPVMGKIRYEYSPRLSPVLRFDPTGAPDALQAGDGQEFPLMYTRLCSGKVNADAGDGQEFPLMYTNQ